MKIIGFTLILVSLLFLQCKKQNEFLEAKPDMSLAIPKTLEEFQTLLRNEPVFNTMDPAWGAISSEEIQLAESVWQSLPPDSRNSFIWAPDIFEGMTGALSSNWSGSYKQVYYANIVLEGIDGVAVDSTNLQLFNTVKGAALFFRSKAFYDLLQLFAKPYDELSASSDLGIVLRLKSDQNLAYERANVQECYEQVLEDLQAAAALLPLSPDFITQPSMAAAHALLARAYLSMGNFNQALTHADLCLETHNALTDFNDVTPLNWTLSTEFLDEVIFHSVMYVSSNIVGANSSVSISNDLYESYESNDLRKSVFFGIGSRTGLPYFRGSYDIYLNKFSGLATDEIHLIRAECLARLGNTPEAMATLNTLLTHRWKKENGSTTYIPKNVTDAEEVLRLVLQERRKELVFRGLRWTDLRRLNLDKHFETTLKREINGVVYTLPPNDPRYVLPIPPNEIELNGIKQNIR